MNWLVKLFKKTTPSDSCGLIAGFVVTEHETGRVVHRETEDVGHLNAKQATSTMLKKRRRLEQKYDPRHYHVQDGMFNTREAFEHFTRD